MARMNRRHPLLRSARLTVATLAWLLCAPLAHAQDLNHPESERLARIMHELEALEPLITEAESAALPEARIRFRYDWLRRDLARVKGGLEAHLEASGDEPRSFAPLRGDYRR